MKVCIKCNQMNESYKTSCKGCGYNMTVTKQHAYTPSGRSNRVYHAESIHQPQFTSDIFSGDVSQKHAFSYAQQTRVKPINPDRAVIDSNDTIQSVEYIINEPEPATVPYRPQSEAATFPQTSTTTSFFSSKWFYVTLSCLAVLVTGISIFYFINMQQSTNAAKSATINLNQLFMEAERNYVAGNYKIALANYRKVVDEAKEEALLLPALERVTEISSIQVNRLITNAETALRRERYATPANDNAILYVNSVLAINPNHPVALDIQQKIVLHFESLAFEATESGNLEKAKNYYENILAVKPYDLYAQEELGKVNSLLEQKKRSASSFLKKGKNIQPSSAAAAKPAPVKNGMRKITTEPLQPRFAEHSVETAGLTIQYADIHNQATPVKATPVGNFPKKMTAPAKNASAKGATAADTSLRNVADEMAIVSEYDTDDGERIYINKALPQLPQNWQYKGYAIVRAECVINAKGLVETVKINSVFSPDIPSTQHALLKKIAIETLKKYRYKAPTQNGQPVRVKLKEALLFK